MCYCLFKLSISSSNFLIVFFNSFIFNSRPINNLFIRCSSAFLILTSSVLLLTSSSSWCLYRSSSISAFLRLVISLIVPIINLLPLLSTYLVFRAEIVLVLLFLTVKVSSLMFSIPVFKTSVSTFKKASRSCSAQAPRFAHPA